MTLLKNNVKPCVGLKVTKGTKVRKGEVCECTEYSILNPTNPYAATKAAAEMLVNSYQHSYKFPSVVVRANNVYGPNQYVEKLIPRFIQLARMGHKLTIHGKGETMRNFLHVFDLIDALDLVIQKGEVGQVYNIGSEEEFSVLEIARKVSQMLGVDLQLEYVTDRLFNDYRYAINSEKLNHCATYRDWETDRKSTRLNSSHITRSRMPSSA